MSSKLPKYRTHTGPSTARTLVRTADGRTFKVPEHKAQRFLDHMNDRKATPTRSATRNQWAATGKGYANDR